MIWNRRSNSGQGGCGNAVRCYAGLRRWIKRRFWIVCALIFDLPEKITVPRPWQRRAGVGLPGFCLLGRAVSSRSQAVTASIHPLHFSWL